MRESLPMPWRTMFTSAPTISQRFAMSFIKLILVASIEFAAYLVISAEGISINNNGCPFRRNGLYSRSIAFSAFFDSIPITIRSGFKKSSIADPSFKNSGLEATSNANCEFLFASSFLMVSLTFFEVSIGTVLFVTATR
ncbi:hypothetical protein ES708_31218 [subsurface metagenome]